MHHASDSNAAQKVCRLLRALSTPEPQRLADIADSAGVNKATALRRLASMAGEGFVLRDEASKRYTLGDEALALGIVMHGCDHIRDRARPTLLRLAALTSCITQHLGQPVPQLRKAAVNLSHEYAQMAAA